ncbi:dipeptidase PepV [Tissierella sp. MSJ-40]|uniref:Dipeptidase PepV n=1 Tax=Tissierella simiarum TaxID=2841534 RepID=A0ABS6E9N4_9FIRM|nr:dipeptidase PepV [Tissierella simiarum]MBU5439634.1 dipeptidase PepV [Tissierella simiarum]
MVFIKDIKIEDEFLIDLKSILRKKTVKDVSVKDHPFGAGITEGLNCILDIAKSYGFRTVNLNNYIGYAEFGQGDEYVGVLGHIDVVPEGNGWSTNPFEPIIKDGKVHGRGALDDKGPLLAALYALKLLKDSNIKLSKKVRVIFGTNEESGTEDIDYYLKREESPLYCFTPDAYFPIVTSEKGILTFELVQNLENVFDDYEIDYIKGGKRSNIVPDYCECKIIHNNNNQLIMALNDTSLKEIYKIDLEYSENYIIIKSKGIASHGSTPELGENAIANILLYLNKVLKLKNDFTMFLEDFSELIGKDWDGNKLGINFYDEESGALTLNLGVINENNSEIRMRFNIRYPVTISHEDILNNIKHKIKDTNFIFHEGNHNAPLYFPKDHRLVMSLKKAYEEVVGEEAELLSTGGGTYAKLMPNTVAFGPLFKDNENLAHQANEFIHVSLLEKCIQIYARAIYELAR